MGDEMTTLIDEQLSLDEERMSELASEFPTTLRRVADARLALDARFMLARGAPERLSAASDRAGAKARFRIPLRASFLPPAAGRFAYAQVVMGLDEHPDLDILSVEPAEQTGEVEVEVEETKGAKASAKKLVEIAQSNSTKRKYKTRPVTIRGIGVGSDTAEWAFDGPPEEGGLPTNVELGLGVALSGPELRVAVRMTAGVRWKGLPGLLPFAWPKGTFRRTIAFDLPES